MDEIDLNDEKETLRDRRGQINPEMRDARLMEEREEAIEQEVDILYTKCTDIELAEKYLDEHVGNPYKLAAQFFNLTVLCGDNTAQLGLLMKTIVENRLRRTAEFIVDERDRALKYGCKKA